MLQPVLIILCSLITKVWLSSNCVKQSNLGRVFGCGRNRDGTLGLGHTKMTVVPKLVEKLNDTIVENIVAGVAMSVFIDKQGHGYWCGQGNGGLEQVL